MSTTFSVTGTLDTPAALGFYAGKSATTPYLVTPTQYTLSKAPTPPKSASDGDERSDGGVARQH
ncbi:hypothetical protein [Luteimicrobium album]|nr:hypothetical protein [Luteimicrobium album]